MYCLLPLLPRLLPQTVSKVTSFVFSPLQKASSYLVDKLDGFKGSFVSSSTYRDRISELESEVADYQSKLVDYEKLKKQVEAYEKFLEVKEKNPDFKFVALSAETPPTPSARLF